MIPSRRPRDAVGRDGPALSDPRFPRGASFKDTVRTAGGAQNGRNYIDSKHCDSKHCDSKHCDSKHCRKNVRIWGCSTPSDISEQSNGHVSKLRIYLEWGELCFCEAKALLATVEFS